MKSILLTAVLVVFFMSNAHAGRLHGVATLDVAEFESGAILIPTSSIGSDSIGLSGFPIAYSTPVLNIYNRNPFPVNVVMTLKRFSPNTLDEESETALQTTREVIRVAGNGQSVFEFSNASIGRQALSSFGGCDQELQLVQRDAFAGLSLIRSNGGTLSYFPVRCLKANYTIDLHWNDELSIPDETSEARFGTTRLTYPLLATTQNQIMAGSTFANASPNNLGNFFDVTRDASVDPNRRVTITQPQYLVRVQE